MDLPDHIGKHIQNFLRPVEGFRIKAGDKYKNKDCVIIIFSIRWIKSENKYYIHGAKWFQGMEEPVDRGGWDDGFGISVPNPKNKFCDMVYPYVNNKGKCFEGIDINKNILL